jgi:holo-[acyl-carrier protein] synthase
MALLIGLDLVLADEVDDAIRAHGARYLERVYSDTELRDCGDDAHRLGLRFAAKEATIKVLGVANGPALWRSIVVRQTNTGFSLALVGAAADLARRARIESLALSTASRGRLACAIVIGRVPYRDRSAQHARQDATAPTSPS